MATEPVIHGCFLFRTEEKCWEYSAVVILCMSHLRDCTFYSSPSFIWSLFVELSSPCNVCPALSSTINTWCTSLGLPNRCLRAVMLGGEGACIFITSSGWGLSTPILFHSPPPLLLVHATVVQTEREREKVTGEPWLIFHLQSVECLKY